MPPIKVGAIQVIPIVVGFLTARFSAKFVGAPAEAIIIAPLPTFDIVEVPIIFVADNLLKIFEPQGKLKGAAISLVAGIEQDVADTIA